MKNLHFMNIILQPEIDKRKKMNEISPFVFIKNKDFKFKQGLILTGNVCEDLFYLVFDKKLFTFHSCYVENDRIRLNGYRYYIEKGSESYYFDPYVEMDDSGLIKCNNKILGIDQQKVIRNYIMSKLENEDVVDYKNYINSLKNQSKNTFIN